MRAGALLACILARDAINESHFPRHGDGKRHRVTGGTAMATGGTTTAMCSTTMGGTTMARGSSATGGTSTASAGTTLVTGGTTTGGTMMARGRKKQQQHHYERTNGSTIMLMFTSTQSSSKAHIGLFGGGGKSRNKNFDDHIRTILLAFIPKLIVATMEMFSSLKNSRMLFEAS